MRIYAQAVELHLDVRVELALSTKAPIVLAQYAWRNEKHAANNGSNFYLAITDAPCKLSKEGAGRLLSWQLYPPGRRM